MVGSLMEDDRFGDTQPRRSGELNVGCIESMIRYAKAVDLWGRMTFECGSSVLGCSSVIYLYHQHVLHLITATLGLF